MRVLRNGDSMSTSLRGGVTAIGNFDGLHCGHQQVIATARAISVASSVPLGAATFDPHPRRLFQPASPPFALTLLADKARLLAGYGMDFLYVIGFDRAFASLSPRAFIDDVLCRHLGISHVVVGSDYRFGAGRAGDASTLRQIGAERGFAVTCVEPVSGEGRAVISSSAARVALEEGNMAAAAEILGRWWEVEGVVLHGAKRGRTIGFPTANIALGERQRPRAGVYVVEVCGQETERWLGGVANYGCRPTVGGKDYLLDVHVFDINDDLYDKKLRVRFLEFLRPECRFDSLEALKCAIQVDAKKARTILRGLAQTRHHQDRS